MLRKAVNGLVLLGAALVATMALALGACGTGGGGNTCTVGVSWNNYQEERWAKWDEPAEEIPAGAACGS